MEDERSGAKWTIKVWGDILRAVENMAAKMKPLVLVDSVASLWLLENQPAFISRSNYSKVDQHSA